MRNIYHDHVDRLRSLSFSSGAGVSLYVPLRDTEISSGRVFAALLNVANDLLQKSGRPKMVIPQPEWNSWTRQGAVTLAIFHFGVTTEIIPLAIRLPPRVVVAKSFHVKPLLAAAQEYVEAMLLHFHDGGADLYRVNTVTEQLVDSYLPSELSPKADWPSKLSRGSVREFLEFLKEEVTGSVRQTTRLLGVTGNDYTELQNTSFWGTAKMPVIFLPDPFRARDPQNAFSILRLRLSRIIHDAHAARVAKATEGPGRFDDLNVQNLGVKIVNAEISKLCVSLDNMVFGELDPLTGEVSIHRTQQDASDDDLLDDMLELAIDRGIEVSVVPKKHLPSGKLFVAS